MRRNIFTIISESFNVKNELRKLNEIFTKYSIFSSTDNKVTFKTYMSRIFPSWVGAGTCISLDEFLTTVKLYDYFPEDEKKLFEVAQHNLEIHINMIEYMIEYTYNNKKNFIHSLREDNINMYKRLITKIMEKISSKFIRDSMGLYYVIPIDNDALVVAESAVNDDNALSVLMFLHSSSQGNLEKKREILRKLALEFEAEGVRTKYNTDPGDDFMCIVNNARIRHHETRSVIDLTKGKKSEEIEEIYNMAYKLYLLAMMSHKYSDEYKGKVKELKRQAGITTKCQG